MDPISPTTGTRLMLANLVPDLDAELAQLRQLGPSGYIIAFNYTVFGPEFMKSGYPDEWRAEYEEKNYFMGDPILMWAFVKSGVKRWSEINMPDPRHVLQRAQEFDIRYGVAISVIKGRKRSVLTVARGDRELKDAEIAGLAAKFETWCNLTTNRAALTDRELSVLRLLGDGHTQREIAEGLGIVEATVKQRAVSATHKLGASNRIHAVAIALKRGYFD